MEEGSVQPESSGGLDHEQGLREEEDFGLSEPVRSFVGTVRAVLVKPAGYFRRLAPKGRTLNSLIFALVCSITPLPLALLVAPWNPSSANNPGSGGALLELLRSAEPAGLAVVVVISLILFPLIAVLSSTTSSIFVRPTVTDIEVTFRVYFYTSVVALLGWIPVAGLLATFYLA